MAEIEGGREIQIIVDASNEQVILGTVVAGWDTHTQVVDKLFRIFGPDHFLAIEHASIWTTMREMRARKLGWDPATARQISGGTFDENLESLICAISDVRPDVPENLDYHVECMLWDRSKATTLQGPIPALLESLRDPKSDPERTHAIARQIPNALKSGDRKHLYDGKNLVRTQVAQIRARMGRKVRYPFGIAGLDFYESHEAAKIAGVIDPEKIAGLDGRVRRMLPGSEPGFITLVSSASGGGKTSLACALTLALARRKRRVLYCAWEPKAGITLESLACQSLGWSRTRVLQGQLTEEELSQLEAKMAIIAQHVRFMGKGAFYNFSGQKKSRTNEENLDIFAGYVADSGCDVVIADLWKYALVSQKPDDEEEALKYQQAMCEDMHFHLFLLQQQAHKRMDMRTDRRPSREGVKGSGTYLEIVDNFLAPHIPSLWKPGLPTNKFEVFVLKQRYGRWPVGIEFDWNPDSGEIKGGVTIPYEFDKPSGEKSSSSKSSKEFTHKGKAISVADG